MLSIIDRYIAKAFVGYFIAGISVFVTLFLAVDFMSSYMNYDTTFPVLMEYYKYMFPTVVYQMLPVSCLLGTLFTLSQLNKSNELVALFSMGMSLARVSAPIVALVAAISVMSFWLSDKVLPTATKKKNYIFYTEMQKRPWMYSTIKTDKIWYRSENVIFNIQTMNAEKGMAQGVTLYYFDENWNLSQLIKANRLFMKDKLWDLKDGVITLFTQESSFPLTKTFKSKKLSISDDLSDIRKSTHQSDVLSLQELKHYIKKNKEAGLDTLRFEVDYHGKFGFAFAGLVLSLLGIPFSARHSRQGGGAANLGICMMLTFGYWILYSSAMTLGKNGYIPPIASAWGPNIFMGMAAFYLLLQQKK